MNYAERIQAFIHKIEVDEAGVRWVNYLALTLMVVALGVWYDTHCFRSFSAPEAMDAAQVGRNLAEGRGFSTEFIRPFSIYLFQKHDRALAAARESGTNSPDPAQLHGWHPDLANAPLYPVALAGLFKAVRPDWKIEMRKPFWTPGGRFERYKPEFIIAIFNQVLLLAAVLLTFQVAKTMLDVPTAWLAAVLMLYCDTLWNFSISGLPTMLLLVIFLGLIWCLASFEARGLAEKPKENRRFVLAALAGLLAGLGMLTRYSFGWVIVPVFVFFVLFGGQRRMVLAATTFLVFAASVLPWIMRNVDLSGTAFGTAGYAVLEQTGDFTGSRLMQSMSPDVSSAYYYKMTPYAVKFLWNIRNLFQDDVPHLGGGWMGILFLAGLLLGLRTRAARRLRYFTMFCLGVFLIITAMSRTDMSSYSDVNGENLLVLLMPLAVIFGTAFFLSLLNQMELPAIEFRYAVIGLVVFLVRLQLTLTFLPPKTKTVAYPPYFPPDIQKFSAWMKPDELIMSDMPWAVAWYGDRPCVWTTINSQYEFNLLHDFIKPVNALYLSQITLNGQFLHDCFQGGDNWYNFGYQATVLGQVPKHFPLAQIPTDAMLSGLFITDHQRWQSE